MVWSHEFRAISFEYTIGGGWLSPEQVIACSVNDFTSEFISEHSTEPVRQEGSFAKCPASDMSKTKWITRRYIKVHATRNESALSQ